LLPPYEAQRSSYFCLLDVIVSDSEADFFLELKHEILARQHPVHKGSNVTRPILVFFRTKAAMMNFYGSTMMESIKKKVSVIDETLSKARREGLFLHATQQGSITLMIRDFGRGTDFKCFDTQLLQIGGVHVIQAFFSTEKSEETQIKGRTARQGANGSYR
jgi:preprotein translocase subunit SecA